ncbi:large subunit ribosomal protein L9 [Allopseudospirillum japonicum]|uniref:Large ribosomal subunit protein bL9 n=1 Tax=Allopseudospirillum japonicum TaxID=64971 RepID=A0A1H6RZU1_9GAMM|nr:50S ribosomal protein L9 [Allopseudospirillum japonicum]SEI57300.1 large subunit ribosomal protein L9 [Allopseudospirillum japonicum]
MEVILLEKVGKLGGLGDVVKVKNGYGRNFLLPYGKAVPATEENKAGFDQRRAELEAAARARFEDAQARAEGLNEIELSISAKAGDEGKLFGSIGPRDLAEAVSQSGIQVAKSEVRMPDGPIRTVGEYDIRVHLHPEVDALVRVIVVAE